MLLMWCEASSLSLLSPPGLRCAAMTSSWRRTWRWPLNHSCVTSLICKPSDAHHLCYKVQTSRVLEERIVWRGSTGEAMFWIWIFLCQHRHFLHLFFPLDSVPVTLKLLFFLDIFNKAAFYFFIYRGFIVFITWPSVSQTCSCQHKSLKKANFKKSSKIHLWTFWSLVN